MTVLSEKEDHTDAKRLIEAAGALENKGSLPAPLRH